MKKQAKHTKHSKHEDNLDVSSPSTSTTHMNIDDNLSLNHLTNEPETSDAPSSSGTDAAHQQLEQIFWSKSTNEEEKTREEEFDDYLADLLL